MASNINWPLPKSEVIISDPAVFERKKAQLLREGPKLCQVIADFDRTLTTAYTLNGERGASTYGIIESSRFLTDDYRARMQELFNTYYPIEVDSSVPFDEKVKKMVEWWEKANAALIAERAPIALIPEACAKANWMFRAQTERMFEICDNNHIPILVFSAGITDVIDEMIKQRILGGKELPYMHVISNKLRPDENGTIVGFEGSIIHVFNKNEHAVADAHVAWWDKVKKRKNAILLGDSPGDVHMADGLEDQHAILRIGFLNENVEAKLEAYKKLFDVVVTNDGPMDFVVDLLNEILAQKQE